ncbi:ABC transporter CDR4 [Cryphonectria parasitica EP155]|uniref:ABC transporter CDR4 n=1 Tax=Cryphonectria parasitica (strain ATCC 38755 / EP155) TaxID=660469 RepID=A0A9P4XW72_CRYP1|nr:ABC transporter CDR4 [Cryphonectria parasitica EP155]KAF3761700.1 ABC transporter CDR4 [Cryphonectria parasitica EP155]
MSFALSAFGNYDRSAQTGGVPALHRTTSRDVNEDSEMGLDRSLSAEGKMAAADAEHSEKNDETSKAQSRGNDTSDSDGDEVVEVARRESMVQTLARKYSNVSGVVQGGNPFAIASDDPDSPLNPNGEKFSARAWAKTVLDLVSKEGKSFRTSGIAFQNMNVFGFGAGTDFQKDVANIWLDVADGVRSMFGGSRKRRIDILRQFDGVVNSGEMLVVLGPPGSGCSTFLKTISGEMNGIYLEDEVYLNYQGVSAAEMHKDHRGECIYTAEVDVHFPMLTVGDTLTFAARARAPRQIPGGVPKNVFTNHVRDVVMAMFGISHTINTRVGNEYVRGVSGGERKRVTISEAALSGAPLQCWDNSTRGLDSANAIEFCKTLRLQSELFGSTACVSIYQAPQSAYDLFDKAAVLYEGRQIFFGRADAAKQYFINLGFECPARQTTPDFLTSMTSPQERIVRPNFEGKAPRTPDEFAECWKNSAEYKQLQAEIEAYKTEHPIDGPDAEAFRAHRRAHQSKNNRSKSPYTLDYWQQVKLCLWRGWKRLMGDPSLTIGALMGNTTMALIISSVFFNLQMTTSSFFQRGALLFFACLMNAFASALEILTLYAQRPIVEKHARYAMYHPSAEAVASMLCDLPYKIGNTIVFNLTLYFMANLRREPGAFFFYLLTCFLATIAMSMMFRTIASSSRTLSQAMVPAAIIILGLVIFTGFVIPIDYMLDWCRWMNYIDPLAYAFEAVMVNEFHNRNYTCTAYVPSIEFPGYNDVGPLNHVCSAVGSVAGLDFVNGDAYINTAFSYYHSHKWRDIGILIGFIIFFLFTYMITAEFVSEKKSKGEVLVFRLGQKPAFLKEQKGDAEGGKTLGGPVVAARADDGTDSDKQPGFLEQQRSVFHWKDVCYEVKIKNETRQILDHVDGWVKPGTLTALMGVSGAGKTTLLDCLADRTSMGVITGQMLVDGHPRDASFQRKTGYVQQQDLHLQTTTVREALNFSALLRQPPHVPREEKLAYVDEVIKLLDMHEYADAVVGVPGEGLNVEQRKRLTIGVELAAKPPLLLFVDEPTSGLDSQTSWAILDLLEKLTKSGQAVLCTIHQPSAMLFQRFDRLLFLARGGKTVYFGDIGKNSQTMSAYFERNGAPPCPPEANPAEWMLEAIGAAPGSESDIDWFKTWRESPECASVHQELQRLKDAGAKTGAESSPVHDKSSYREFAAPFSAQLREVLTRVFSQYWRTPSYIYSKAALCISISLYIGLVFLNAPNSIQGLQNQMFAIFNILTVFGQLTQQQMPHFVVQRDLYEVRERPSKVYSWKVFMLSQIIVELPWNTLMAVFMFVCWYYPVGLYRNAEAAGQVHERGALIFLFLWAFLLFTSTFTDFIIAGFETAEAGGNIANLIFSLCLIFCGVLATPSTFPRFWIFMYRVSPFTYLVSGMLSAAVANTDVVCAANEYLTFQPLSNLTCGDYMEPYINVTGGYLTNANATSDCQFCSISESNVYLTGISTSYGERWRNFGIMWAFIIFNIFAALGLYWLARVPKGRKVKQE